MTLTSLKGRVGYRGYKTLGQAEPNAVHRRFKVLNGTRPAEVSLEGKLSATVLHGNVRMPGRN
jgi:hypothetical protein